MLCNDWRCIMMGLWYRRTCKYEPCCMLAIEAPLPLRVRCQLLLLLLLYASHQKSPPHTRKRLHVLRISLVFSGNAGLQSHNYSLLYILSLQGDCLRNVSIITNEYLAEERVYKAVPNSFFAHFLSLIHSLTRILRSDFISLL
jgi:hypothetical protein